MGDTEDNTLLSRICYHVCACASCCSALLICTAFKFSTWNNFTCDDTQQFLHHTGKSFQAVIFLYFMIMSYVEHLFFNIYYALVVYILTFCFELILCRLFHELNVIGC
jgi:hypothetical protein